MDKDNLAIRVLTFSLNKLDTRPAHYGFFRVNDNFMMCYHCNLWLPLNDKEYGLHKCFVMNDIKAMDKDTLAIRVLTFSLNNLDSRPAHYGFFRVDDNFMMCYHCNLWLPLNDEEYGLHKCFVMNDVNNRILTFTKNNLDPQPAYYGFFKIHDREMMCYYCYRRLSLDDEKYFVHQPCSGMNDLKNRILTFTLNHLNPKPAYYGFYKVQDKHMKCQYCDLWLCISDRKSLWIHIGTCPFIRDKITEAFEGKNTIHGTELNQAVG